MTQEELRNMERSLVDSQARSASEMTESEQQNAGSQSVEEIRQQEALNLQGRSIEAMVAAERQNAENMPQDDMRAAEEVDGVNLRNLDGDTSMDRDLRVGRNLEVSGEAHIHHNLVVEGVVQASNISGMGDALQDYATKEEMDEALERINRIIEAMGDVPLDELQRLFLSRLSADVAAGKITFQQGLDSLGLAIFLNGASFGNFIAGLYNGTGAKIDAGGNAEVESLKVRSSLEVLELLINRLAAIEGDQLLTEADTIESVTDLGDNCYRLQLRSKWDGYFTSMSPGAVLKGIYNSLAHAAETQSATVVGTENNADYYTSWMRVNSVNQAANSIEVVLYPDAQVPSGTNHAPVELMNIARWGHQTDTSRQSCLYLSSTEGKIVKLKDVTAPIISESNIALSLGTIPQFVFDYLHGQAKPVTDKDDMLFADSIAVRNLYFYPKGDGTCEIEYVDRGSWQSGASYYHKAPGTLTNGKWEVSDVWHIGCRWRCLVNLTAEEPRWNSTDWAMIEGNRNFAIDFVEPFQLYDADNFNASLTIKAMLGYSDITDDIADADIAWSRRSWDAHGIERMSADTLWAISRAGTGKSIALTLADIGVDAAGWPSRLEITATATLRDGSQAQATFAYPL